MKQKTVVGQIVNCSCLAASKNKRSKQLGYIELQKSSDARAANNRHAKLSQ